MTDTYLVQIEGVDAGGKRWFWLWSNGQGHIDGNDTYDPRVIEAGAFSRQLFRSSTTLTDRSSVGYGEIVINNKDGALDPLLDVAFDGRSVRISRVDGLLILEGTVAGVEFTRDTITFRVRDYQEFVAEQLLVPETYAGNNVLPDGLEGVEGDIKGSSKPLTLGKVRSAPLPNVNTSKLIYQTSVRAQKVGSGISTAIHVLAINGVEDGGAALTAGADYPDLATLLSTSPAASNYRAFSGGVAEGAYVRLGSIPARLVTADMLEGNSAADRTVPELMRRVCVLGGVPYHKIVGVEEAVALCPWESGYFCHEGAQHTAGEVLDALAASIHGYWIGQADGSIKIGVFRAPQGLAVKYFDEYNILQDGTAIERRVSNGEGLPFWRVHVEYQKLWAVQSKTELAGVALARQEYLGREYRKTDPAYSDAIKARHPLSTEITFRTLLDSLADANSLRDTLFSMYSVKRDMYQIALNAKEAEGVDIGDEVRLSLPRFGLQDGKNFITIGRQDILSQSKTVLSVWG